MARFKVEVTDQDFSFPAADTAVIKNDALAQNLGPQRDAVIEKLNQVAPVDPGSVSLGPTGTIVITDPVWVKALKDDLAKPPVPGQAMQNVCSNGSCLKAV